MCPGEHMSRDLVGATTGGVGGLPRGEGFEKWLAALVPDVRRLGLHLAGNRADAADLAQATCLRALEKRALFVHGAGSDLKRWVGRIMVNLHHDARRRSAWEIPSDWMEEVRAQEPEPAAVWKMVADEDLHAAVEDLPSHLREVYVRRALRGSSYETISAELNIPIRTAATRMFRARAHLRAALTPKARNKAAQPAVARLRATALARPRDRSRPA